MFTTVLLFVPGLTCLFWLALNPLLLKKDKAFKALELLLAVACIALFAEACLPLTDRKVMMTLFLTKQFFAPMIVPAALAYNYTLVHKDKQNPYFQAWLAVPASLIFAQVILILISGSDGFMETISNPAARQSDKVGNLIHFCSFRVFYGIMLIETLLFIVATVKKAVKGIRHIQLFNTTAFIIIYAGLEASVMFNEELPSWITATISILLAIILFSLSYSGLFHERKETTVSDLIAGVSFFITHESLYERQNESHLTHHNEEFEQMRKSAVPHDGSEPRVLRQSGSLIAEAHQNQADEDRLRIRFEDLIVTEQSFLKQGIRLSDIATMLDTNRTYVSRLVNNTYNMSFSDYINTLRIDYAEQYLLHHRDAKQSDIAVACGFPNASAFNNVFKKITGVTPKIWLATNS